MAIQIDENLLLTFAAVVFIPLFVFLVKLIIDIGNIKAKIDNLTDIVKEHKEIIGNFSELLSEVKFIKLRLGIVEGQSNGTKGGGEGSPDLR